MSTFGDIDEPGSCATWEDWDDNTERIATELKWQRDLECPDEINVFLILEGKYLADNINSQVQNQQQVLINSIPGANLHLYRSTDTSKYYQYTCTIVDYNLAISNQIVELLRPYLTVSKYVLSIQTKPLAEYQSATGVVGTQSCVVRAITTTQSQSLNVKSFPRLDLPSMISGVSAKVISFREHYNESGTAIIAFLKNTEQHSMEEMGRLLGQLHLSQSENRT